MFEFGVNVDSWESATITPLYLVTDLSLLTGCAIPAVAPMVVTGPVRPPIGPPSG